MTPTEPVCAYCRSPGPLHRDHVVPRARGGPDDATNIVMACRPCNAKKSDQLPSEWLGDRCPAPVLLIEARVHAKLKASFARRDFGKKAKPEQELFAYSVNPATGAVEYLGTVVSETENIIRIGAVSALELMFGLWNPSGAIYDVPRANCRLFSDRESCVESSFKRRG